MRPERLPRSFDPATAPRWIAILLLLSMVAPATARAICSPGTVLVPGTAYASSPNPRVSLPLDLNEDGILDVAVCSANAGGSNGRVSVYIGNGAGGVGDGTFTPGASYSTEAMSLGMTSGDFNGDGILDLAVSNFTGQSVSILLGMGAGGVGDGTFAPAVSYPIGGSPYGIASADFNEDGITDLVVADNGVFFLRLLIGQGSAGVGDGTFVAGTSLGVPNLPLSVVIGDFDENGHADIAATASYSGKVSVFLGTGTGSFSAATNFSAGLEPYDLVVDDIDQDGISDLIVGNSTIGGVAVLRGQGIGGVGNGSFGPPQISGNGVVNAGSVVPGDFDGDGVRDVVTAHSAAGTIFFMRGLGDGALAAPVPVTSGSFPIGMHAGDFNEDGLLDLAVANYTGSTLNRLVILLGFCAPQPAGPGPVLDDVRDAPNDQGGKVFVVWQRSSLDGLEGTSVTGYRVWRRIPPSSALARAQGVNRMVRARAIPSAAGGVTITYWEAMATLPAQRLEGYGYTSATTQDSLPGSNPFTAFFVTAITADPNIFYDSAVDSGYSVDNLVPPAPAPFTGTFVAGSGFALHWGVSDAPDLLEYRLHRGGFESFQPSPSNMIFASPDTGFVDPDGFGQYYYKVAAVDVHQNVGPYLTTAPDRPTAVLATVISAEVDGARVTIVWRTSIVTPLKIERRAASGGWIVVSEIEADGLGIIRHEEDAPAPGEQVFYRLFDPASGIALGETSVVVPGFSFALTGIRPNPYHGRRMEVSFSLEQHGLVTLQLLDPSGRRLASRRGTFAAGRHSLELMEGQVVPPGVYFLTLRQGDRVARSKVSVLR